MAGAITSIPRFFVGKLPQFFRPVAEQSFRSVQTVFRRFRSSSTNHSVLVGSPKVVYPGHPEYHHLEESIAEHVKWPSCNTKFFKAQQRETVTMMDLMKEIRKLNERFEQILPLLKDITPKKQTKN